MTITINAGALTWALVSATTVQAADIKTIQLAGCWKIASVSDCRRPGNVGSPSHKILCFGQNHRLVRNTYLACEGEGFIDDLTYRLSNKQISIKYPGIDRPGHCVAEFDPLTDSLELNCDIISESFSGQWTKLCSKINADGSYCFDAQLQGDAWKAEMEDIPSIIENVPHSSNFIDGNGHSPE